MSTAAFAQTGQNAPDFGPNVIIFDSTMPAAQIQSTLESISKEDQFSTNRHAVFFKPGAYSVEAPVGYYESIAGLGASPNDVTINGFLTPNFGVPVYGTPTWPQANLTDTFWRSMENMTFNPATNTLQNAPPHTLQWGVSQAAPLRRLQINGGLELTNSYCGNASGGFISDTVVTGNVNPCSQQQWYTRNSSLGSWAGGVWNMVFSGVQGAPAQSYPAPPETVVPTTPVSREKPFLYVDANGNYNVFAPGVRRDSIGTSWSTGTEAGRSLPIHDFFIAQPTNTAQQINAALASGRNLILTPGVYQLDRSIEVKKPNTVVLGLGYATLVPQTGAAALTVADVDGVQVAGLIIDAGPVKSPVLFQIGKPHGAKPSDQNNPIALNDVVFRVGGASAGSAVTSLEVDHDNVILDNIWAWRADHGNGVGWTQNTADHGLVINGDRVTALGLAVEHYQKEQVLWNGNGGETIFYQSELPYDPPSQSAWMDGTANGYPSYVVANSVTSHLAYGLGIYSFFNLGINILEDNAMTVPDVSGIAVHDAGTVWLNGRGQITHVINGEGAAVNSTYADKLSPVIAYP
ncbi:MAG: glycosyl hydrolase family 28-related protein [Acidobacteriaceae bacterium]